MNSFTVTIQFYDKSDTVYTKHTKWDNPHRLAQHVMRLLDRENIMWRTVTVEWKAK